MIDIVPPTADEMALIYDSWVKSFRKSPWAGVIPNNLYEATQRATIQGILARGASIQVALAPRVPGIFEGRRVMGWICTEPAIETLHFWYVKDDFRKKGIGKALLAEATGKWFQPRYTHRTRASELLPKRFRWDPVPARVLSEKSGQERS